MEGWLGGESGGGGGGGSGGGCEGGGGCSGGGCQGGGGREGGGDGAGITSAIRNGTKLKPCAAYSVADEPKKGKRRVASEAPRSSLVGRYSRSHPTGCHASPLPPGRSRSHVQQTSRASQPSASTCGVSGTPTSGTVGSASDVTSPGS